VAIGSGAKATNAGDVALGAGSTTSAAVAVSSATVNGVTYGGFAGTAPTSAVSIGSAGNERQLQNVAAGQITATSTDAVNGSQLYSVASEVGQINTSVSTLNNQVTQNTTNIQNLQNGSAGMFQVSADANTTAPTASGTKSTAGGDAAVASGNSSTALGNDAQATASNSVALGAGSVADRANSVSVGSAGNDRQITHVAAGTAADDAVNVSQLQATENGVVQYDKNTDGSNNFSSVTLGGGSGSTTNTTIHNVAAGTANNDAVNVSQLNAGITSVENWSKSYTDQQVGALNGSIDKVDNRASAGVAAAMAMAGLPQAYEPGKSMAAIAAGSFRGESSIAVGVSTISEGGRWVYKLTGSTDSRGDAGVTIGAGMQW
jgi:trimeric autotransporter adhesin